MQRRKINRRNFLKRGTALGMGAFVLGCSWKFRGTAGSKPMFEKSGGLLAELKDLEANAATLVYTKKDGPIILARVQETVVAYKSVCPHTACELNDGEGDQPLDVRRNEIRCFLHDSYFDIKTGRRIRGPAKGGTKLPPYPVKLIEGKVFKAS